MLNQQHQLPTKPSSSKKFFLKMLPQIHTQSEESLRKTQSYTTTARSAYSQKTSPRFESRKSNENCADAATPISDYFDPVQIHSAISKTNNVTDRIKVLDHVLRKRNTIVESEKQNQMERIAPMVKNFVGTFRIKDKARIQTPKVNKFRNSIRNVNFDQDPSSDSFLTDPELILSARFQTEQYNFDEEQHFSSPRKLSTVDCSSPMFWKPLHTQGSANQSLASSSLVPKEKQLNLVPVEQTRAQSESKATPPSTAIASQRRNGFLAQFSKDMIVGAFKGLMKQKFQHRHENFSSFRPDPIKKPKRPTIVIKKKDDSHAKKRLEQDIFNFLVKSGDSGRSALQTTKSRKDSKIKNIETRALLHFEEYQAFKEDQRRSSHQKPLQTQPDRFKLHK